jgi:hypothetical protein
VRRSAEGTDKAINSFSLNSYSTSIASQVAGAGIQAGKSLLSKKVKLQTATLKASHYVLFKSQNVKCLKGLIKNKKGPRNTINSFIN